jgi:hypothetical protein
MWLFSLSAILIKCLYDFSDLINTGVRVRGFKFIIVEV